MKVNVSGRKWMKWMKVNASERKWMKISAVLHAYLTFLSPVKFIFVLEIETPIVAKSFICHSTQNTLLSRGSA